ncbi:ATP-binding cassette domain-containing protein [Roseobacter sp. HKCCD9010]|uniref:ABC transporter ATP-binding protein n=1 Tax=unclassified Roseobacter TaxID=196798 RepID=UPI00149311CD|nr:MULTISPECIES: ABC transporter ATP-binding protein [unclassified Roseobacter]MBF9051732.1 ATP-binding cassette domain-containing protein [Rhodobacterales bacterium HKCCD4356]NNV13725.1 ATP-binding cassette domain-containing protein [Roseobacter sp. HKCCD7357]NNV17750.1 ATP-binding cassette domain-containing protein [Roseobacter sp. HKCCD8768]NNV27357.1 ATP-binding cassette domain-containing protein [Roseobacter sp. HKCCD8192]NNV31477.1 ATP-binding cassette domain-containing protein [Roseobac
MSQLPTRGTFARVLAFAASRWARRPGLLSIIVGLQIVSTGADVSIPILTGRLVAAVADGATPWAAFWGLMALGVLSITAKIVSYFAIIDLTIPTMREVEAEAFARVQRLPASWHANAFAGSTVRKITRGAWALDDMGDLLLLALGPAVLVLIGTIATLTAFRIEVGLVALAGAAIFLAISLALTLKWVAPAARLANAQDSRVSGALADAITSNAVVKAHAAEAREDARIDGVLRKWAHRSRRTWRRGTWSGLAQDLSLWLLRALVLGGALLAFMRGAAGAGEIAFTVSALGMLDGYLRQIGNHVRNLQKAVNDAEEMVDLMQDNPEKDVVRPPARALPPRAAALSFRHVHYAYEGAPTELFTDLNVDIPMGQKVGLVGRSGSGKTTFVKLVQRLHEITGGTITLDGVDIASVSLAELRSHVALVPQEPILFHRSLADNIGYARPGAKMDEVYAAASKAGAAEFIERLEKGYGTKVGERGVKLSGGERQRVAIARAFLSDAPVLIMDEATSSLDSEAEARVAEAAERLMEGRTTLVIAHRLATVERMDRILVFDRGRIVEDGTPAELMARRDGLYRALREKQTLAA